MAKSRTCKGCGKFFTPVRRGQVYHDEDCRKKHYAEIYDNYRKLEVLKICPGCGIEFPTTRPMQQVYCSPTCRDSGNGHPHQEAADERMHDISAAHPERHSGYSKEKVVA